VSPAQTGLRSPVVCGSLTFAPTPLTSGAPAHQPFRAYPTHPQSCPPLPGCKRLHLSFCPSWAARSSGRFKTQIVSSTGGSGGPTHPWSCPPLPDCKRLHLTFSPSWTARSSGRFKTQIVRYGCRGGGVSWGGGAPTGVGQSSLQIPKSPILSRFLQTGVDFVPFWS